MDVCVCVSASEAGISLYKSFVWYLSMYCWSKLVSGCDGEKVELVHDDIRSSPNKKTLLW